MDSVFKVTSIENPKIQEYKDKAMEELNQFFNKKWIYNTPKIFIVDDRKTIDLLREDKTEDWVVGWSWGGSEIFILNPENIARESSHKEEYNIEKLIKHELCHAFFNMFLGKCNFAWIREGLSLYVANQIEDRPIPQQFKDFLEDKKVYLEAGYTIKLLIDEFGKDKLFEFLQKQTKAKDKSELENVFMEVFNASLGYNYFNSLLK